MTTPQLELRLWTVNWGLRLPGAACVHWIILWFSCSENRSRFLLLWSSPPEEEKDREEKRGKYLKKENIFFPGGEEKKEGKGGKDLSKNCQGYWEVSVLVAVSRLFPIFVGFCFWFRRIWSWKKSLIFGFGKFGLGKKVSVSVLENLVSGKKSWFRFQTTLFREKKVSVSVSLKILVLSFSVNNSTCFCKISETH